VLASFAKSYDELVLGHLAIQMKLLHPRFLALLFAMLIVCRWGVATAAEFTVSTPDAQRIVTINISGVIQRGDDLRFRTSLARVLPLLGIVILESPGGDLQAGLNIGREISARAYATLVKSGAVCASACALAWLAGDWRYMAPGARIGFHAAYAKEGNALIEKGAANALIGAYLNTLKLPDDAIKYITKAAPTDVEWLSVNAAMHAGINLMVAGENGE
jgi:hypothetical protein